ncbi:hypothetical protein C5708_11300 [Caulobacter sp. CCUG 60055]|nr:hypothetical protein [Caulobacter sp. CCUG 60055]
MHVALLAFLAAGVTRVEAPPEPRAIEVELVQPVLRLEVRRPKPSPATAQAPPLVPRPAKRPPPPDVLTLPATPAPAPPSTAAVASPPHPAPLPAQAGGLQGALRGSTGCDAQDVVKLSEAERVRCDRYVARTAKGGIPPPPSLGIDADKRAAFDRAAARQEAYRRYKEANIPSGVAGGSDGPTMRPLPPLPTDKP